MAREPVATTPMESAVVWTPPEGDAPSAEFDRIAWFAGQNAAALARGQAQVSYLWVPDLECLTRLLRHASPTTQALRREMLPKHAYRSRLWQGVHDRGEAHVFGAAPVAPEDRERMAPHFPAPCVVHSIPRLRLGPGESLDLSSLPEHWNLGDREEIYVLASIGTLHLTGGARIDIAGNPLALVIQHLHCEGGPGEGGRIAIEPTGRPVDRGSMGGFNGQPGASGGAGANGSDGQSVQSRPSVFGAQASAIPSASARDGGPGAKGRDGENGARGRPGGLCKTAEVLIRRSTGTGNLTISARAGDGGQGGRGGDGGAGGNGGAGGAGHAGMQPPIANGAAGKGGDGGRGGNGGAAGHAGLGSHVFVETPAPRFVTTSAIPGRPGLPGSGGVGGIGGQAGWSGPQGPNHPAPASNRNGLDGNGGRRGRAGRQRPGPEIFLIDTNTGAWE